MRKTLIANSKKRRVVGKKRRIAGWTLAALGLLVAVVWGASGRWEFGFGGRDGTVRCKHGELVIERGDYWAMEPGWIGRAAEFGGWTWWLTPKLKLDSTYAYWYDPSAERKWQSGVVCVKVYAPIPKSVTHVQVEVLLWPVSLLLLGCATLLLRPAIMAHRRQSAEQCAACGYSLTGLGVGAKCPECGRVGGKVSA